MIIHQQIAAGIDLGSNTFRLLVASCTADNMKVLAKQMATVRLGRGLEYNGSLAEESMQRGVEVLQTFRQVLDHYLPERIRVCGTEALRKASNSSLFLQNAEGILQQSIDIINGEEEARLCLAGALAGFTEALTSPLLLVDIGGSSTELIFAEKPGGYIRVESMGVGVVGLTEKFMAAGKPDIEGMDRLLAEIFTAAFNKLKLRENLQPYLIIGCGGTATSMAALDLSLTAYDASMVHGHILQNTAIEKLWHTLAYLPADKRNTLPCLGEGRGEILPAGVRMYHMLLKLLQQDQLRASDTGLLEGILLSGLHNRTS